MHDNNIAEEWKEKVDELINRKRLSLINSTITDS